MSPLSLNERETHGRFFAGIRAGPEESSTRRAANKAEEMEFGARVFSKKTSEKEEGVRRGNISRFLYNFHHFFI